MNESTEAENLHEAQVSVLNDNVQIICQHMERLSALGEETVFLSVNLKDDSSFYSGSSVGKRFMMEKSNVIDMFFQFCKEKYDCKSSLTMDEVNAAKLTPQDLQDTSNLEFQDYVQSICEHVEKLALVGVNSIFLSVNMKNQSSDIFYYGSTLGKNFLSEKSDIVDLFLKYCDDNSLLSKKEKYACELMSHVQAICEHIEKLSSLGEETVFLSVNMENETSFYSGSKMGKQYLDFKSNALDLFYQFCKVNYSGKDPSSMLRKEESTQTEDTLLSSSNSSVSEVNTSASPVNTPSTPPVSSVNKPVLSNNSSIVSLIKTVLAAKKSGTSAENSVESEKNPVPSVNLGKHPEPESRKRSRNQTVSKLDDENEDSDSDIRTLKSRKKDLKDLDEDSSGETHERQLKMLKCSICFKYFHKVKDLKKHEKDHELKDHELVDVFQCEKCGITVYNKQSYKIHMDLHNRNAWKSNSREESLSSIKRTSEQSSDSDSSPKKAQYVRVSKDILKACNVIVDDRGESLSKKEGKKSEKPALIKSEKTSDTVRVTRGSTRACSVSLKRLGH